MAVAFFIVAHSDDWFLFMGNAGLDAVGNGNNGNTIGFVYMTASNFIDGTNTSLGTKVRLRYEAGLRVRENATIATALSMFGLAAELPPLFPAVDAPNVTFDVKQINGRDIAFYSIANTRHYCLRLTDGVVDGSGVAWTTGACLVTFGREVETGGGGAAPLPYSALVATEASSCCLVSSGLRNAN